MSRTKAESHSATTPPSPILQLQRANGEKVELTVSRLEQYLAQAELLLRQQQNPTKKSAKESENTAELVTQLLSRFGLKTAEDLIIFLKSPAGEAILALIEEEWAEIIAMEYHVQQEQIAQQHHKHILFAFLLLGLLHHREAHARRLDNEEAAAEKRLHDKQKEAYAQEVANTSTGSGLDYPAYTEAAQAVEEKLHGKHRESKQLEEQLAELAPQHKATEAKYNIFHRQLNALQEFAKGFEHDPVALAMKEPSKEIEDGIKAKVDGLTKEIDENVAKIDALLVANQNDEARDLMHQNNAKNLQIAALNEMLMVAQSKGEKVIYNDKFEPAKSFDDAAYILSRGTHIEEKDGKRYLLKAGQTLDTASSEVKAEAEKQYLQLKPTQIMSVRQLVHHNHQLENTRYNSLSAQSDQMQKDIILLTDKLAEMQEARSKAELSLRPTPASAPSLQMKPVPSAKLRPSPANLDFQQSYEHVVQLMSENPSPEAIARLKELTARMNPSMTIKQQLSAIKPHMPIPETTKRALLTQNHVGRAWRDVREPGIASQLEISTTPTPYRKPRGAG